MSDSRKREISAITVRHLPQAVTRVIREKARRERLSLNRAIVSLLEEATGTVRSSAVLHHELDHLAGTWSASEYEDFMESVKEHRRIDPDMWK